MIIYMVGRFMISGPHFLVAVRPSLWDTAIVFRRLRLVYQVGGCSLLNSSVLTEHLSLFKTTSLIGLAVDR